MKKNIAFLMITLAGLVACQKAEVLTPDAKPEQEQEQVEVTSYTLTVKAQKEADTKGLSLDGTTLNAIWKSGETVAVYKGGSYLGDLVATPDTNNPALATLSGDVTGNIVANDNLVLLFPSRTWDYTGQAGVLLETDGSIEKKYDFAKAEVTVSSVIGNQLQVDGGAAHFENQQSIYRINFMADGPEGSFMAVKTMTLSASQGKLVRSMAVGSAPTYGDLSVSMATSSADLTDGLVCVSVRNEDKTAQTYNFSVSDAAGKVYIGSKNLTADNLNAGFLRIKNVWVGKVTVPHGTSQQSVDTAL